jgi:hypothetical protein
VPRLEPRANGFANKATQVSRDPGNDNHDRIADTENSAENGGHDYERHYDSERCPFVPVFGESELLTRRHEVRIGSPLNGFSLDGRLR